MINTESNRQDRVVASALWAAWADALGFVSELTDEAGLRRRLNGQDLTQPPAWQRRVGGKFGVQAQLPAGCYSDDTQLRLATSRAISSAGFDVEAFARVELPVWPTYALGGGRASKAAASHLAKPNTAWFGNQYSGWHTAGGNGAAMRIQPHVWSTPTGGDYHALVNDVIVNAITTHGHPRALVGAVLHALALAHALETSTVPGPAEWPTLLERAREAVTAFDERTELATVWRPSWEQTCGETLAAAWQRAVDECAQLLDLAESILNARHDGRGDGPGSAYHQLLTALHLMENTSRGSGTATVCAAVALAAHHDGDPETLSRLAAKAVGSDTDTIATMGAAIVGATVVDGPPGDLLDRAYLTAEARRLHGLSQRTAEPSIFQYPDLLRWSPPRSQLDAVGTLNGEAVLAGIAWLTPTGDRFESRSDVWTWHRSDLGQTFLLKHRPTLRPLTADNTPRRRSSNVDEVSSEMTKGSQGISEEPRTDEANIEWGQQRLPVDVPSSEQGIFDAAELPTSQLQTAGNRFLAHARRDSPTRSRVNVEQMLRWVAVREFDDRAVGYAVRRLMEVGSLEQLLAFTIELRDATRDRVTDY